ncbi:MAG: hypothetical protein ACI32N_03855 [Bulleidia sp.]
MSTVSRMLLPEAVLVMIITGVIVSICTTCVRLSYNQKQIENSVIREMHEACMDRFYGWQGCVICTDAEADPS